MALTLESFWRYASSTCQRTSSDREPTLRSSKFWGGRRLASRRCSASYKFVCCGLLRAWCSLGLPIGVYRAGAALCVAATTVGQPFSIRSLAAPRRPKEIAGPAAPRARCSESG